MTHSPIHMRCLVRRNVMKPSRCLAGSLGLLEWALVARKGVIVFQRDVASDERRCSAISVTPAQRSLERSQRRRKFHACSSKRPTSADEQCIKFALLLCCACCGFSSVLNPGFSSHLVFVSASLPGGRSRAARVFHERDVSREGR